MSDADVTVIHPQMSMLGGGEMVCFLVLASAIERGAPTRLFSERIANLEVLSEYRRSGASNAVHYPIKVTRPSFLGTYPYYANIAQQMRKVAGTRPRHVLLTQSIVPGLSRFRDCRVVLYVHYPDLASDESQAHGALSKAYLYPIKAILERQLGYVDTLVCNSKYTRDAIRQHWGHLSPPEPVVVYPSTTRTLDASASWEHRKKRVVYVGRLSFFKRHEVLKELAVKNPSIEYCSIGSSSDGYNAYIRSLQMLKPDNYQIIANAPHSTLKKYLETSLVYVHAAVNEHFGISILEAMLAGAVPMAHDSGGIREILPRELRWNDREELDQKSTELLGNRSLWESWHRRVVDIAGEHSPSRFKEQIARVVFGSR